MYSSSFPPSLSPFLFSSFPDLYCATAAGTLGTRVDFYSSGFTVQPAQFSLGPGTSFVITLTTARTENIRCVVVVDGATSK
jgi:hypothetical protein